MTVANPLKRIPSNGPRACLPPLSPPSRGRERRDRRWRFRSATWRREAADDLESVPALLAVAFYIIGAAIVGFGLLKLKRHVDHPQQTTIGSGLIAILIGVALIAAPAVINALGDTLGLSGGSHTVIKPRL